MRTWVLGVGLALAVVGCGQDDGGETDTDPAGGGSISAATVTELGIETAVRVTWTTQEEGASSFVEYGLDGAFDHTSGTAGAGTEHAVDVVLLKSNNTYQFRAVTLLADGTRLEGEPVEFVTGPPPQGMPRMDVEVIDPAAAEVVDGYILMTTLGAGPSYVAVTDGDGDWVWWAEMAADDLSTARARLSRDGTAIVYNVYQTDRAADQGWIVRAPLDGSEEIWTRTLLAHHDFVELPDGSYGWLGYDQRMVDVVEGEAEIDVGAGPYPMASDTILEGPEGMVEGETPTQIWNMFEDYGVPPWWICEHMWTIGEFVPDYYEWTHGNSIAYVDSEDAYYVMARYMDAFYKVDRATGAKEWQIGGLHGDFTWTSGEPFNHPHTSDVWEDGALVFDNRDHAGAPSRVIEIAWNEADKTVEVVWEYPRPDGALLPILGDARRLSSGNRLVAWSARGEMAELTPEGEVVYRATMDLGSIMTRVIYFTKADLPVFGAQ